jgi:hypothetical protein
METDRLELSAHGVADLPDCIAMWSDPGVAEFTTGKPSSESEVWSRLLRYGPDSFGSERSSSSEAVS